ncbi:MAG: hypothetical protein R3F37_13390 [Candidatus Competibacteraceae bacterium]
MLFFFSSLLFLTNSVANSESVFYDSFESGDLSSTNAGGFKWGGTNYTTLVTSEGRIYSSGNKIDPPDQTDQAVMHQFAAHTGNVTLVFDIQPDRTWLSKGLIWVVPIGTSGFVTG